MPLLNSLTKKLHLNEETLSIIFGVLIIAFILLASVSFLRQKNNKAQITPEAAQTQSETFIDGPYEKQQIYTIQYGDSLSKIAEKLYGDLIFWPLLSQENGIADPNLIYPNEILILPPKATVAAFASVAKPGEILTGLAIEAISDQVYQVQKSDSLWKICERRYGNGKYWPDIAKLNRLINPDYLEVGWQLSLPDL